MMGTHMHTQCTRTRTHEGQKVNDHASKRQEHVLRRYYLQLFSYILMFGACMRVSFFCRFSIRASTLLPSRMSATTMRIGVDPGNAAAFGALLLCARYKTKSSLRFGGSHAFSLCDNALGATEPHDANEKCKERNKHTCTHTRTQAHERARIHTCKRQRHTH